MGIAKYAERTASHEEAVQLLYLIELDGGFVC